jgi:HSP20 family protein
MADKRTPHFDPFSWHSMAHPQATFESFYGVPPNPSQQGSQAGAPPDQHHQIPHRGVPPAGGNAPDAEKAASATASPDREMGDGEDPVPDPPEDEPEQPPPHHGCPHGHGPGHHGHHGHGHHGHGHRRGGRFHHGHGHDGSGGSGGEGSDRAGGWGGRHWGGPWGWGHRRHGRGGGGGWGAWGGGHHGPHGPHGPRGGPFAHVFGPGGPLNAANVPCPRCGANLLDVFLGPGFGAANSDGDWRPDVDVFETDAAFVVHVPLAGANKEDVGVTWEAEGCELAIAGVVHRPGDEDFLKKLAVGERKVGAFERKVKLGSRATAAQVDVDGITAKLENGLLVVDVPKLKNDFVEIKKVDIE